MSKRKLIDLEKDSEIPEPIASKKRQSGVKVDEKA
jgi:hypothetical protein